MINIDLNRAEKTKRWNIPEKFINYDFYNFLNNTFPLEINHQIIDVLCIKDCMGSLDEWADSFHLQELYGITVDAILKLLNDKGCLSEINKKENFLKYHFPNVNRLMIEILARIEKHPDI